MNEFCDKVEVQDNMDAEGWFPEGAILLTDIQRGEYGNAEMSDPVIARKKGSSEIAVARITEDQKVKVCYVDTDKRK